MTELEWPSLRVGTLVHWGEHVYEVVQIEINARGLTSPDCRIAYAGPAALPLEEHELWVDAADTRLTPSRYQ
jgi:hypothetical protein